MKRAETLAETVNGNCLVRNKDHLNQIGHTMLDRIGLLDDGFNQAIFDNMDIIILPDGKFERYLKHEWLESKKEEWKSCFGITYQFLDGNRICNRIAMRVLRFSHAYSTYFHELCHIATRPIAETLSASSDISSDSYSEALAYSFEGYAKEKFNKLPDFSYKFNEATTFTKREAYAKNERWIMEREAYAKAGRWNFREQHIHTDAWNLIISMLPRCWTFENVYKSLTKRGA